MLKQVALKFLGLCLSPFPILIVVKQAFRRGWSNLNYIKNRSQPPESVTNGTYGESRFMALPTGIKMHYVEKGSRDSTRPLMVFLHGFPEFWYSWRHQLAHFSKDNWCVAPDLRGYNETSKPSGIENYSIDAIVDDVKSLVDGLGREKCILVGHDWGGAIGYHFCGKYPDMVSEYIVCNLPHPCSMKEQLKGLDQMLKSWYILFFQCPIIPEMYFRAFDLMIFDGLFKEFRDDKKAENVEAYKYAFRKKETVTAAINYYRNTLQFADADKLSKRIGDLRVPVLSIFGTGDKYLSVASAQGSRKFIRDFQEVLVPDCSHWVQMEKPDVVNSEIEKYLKRNK